MTTPATSLPSWNFADRVALITGASRGIGRRIALDLARAGARLIVTSTGTDEAEVLRDLGPNARHVQVDLADPESRASFLAVVRSLPALDVCVNNAGVAAHRPANETTEEAWDHAADVNLKAPYFVTQAAADVMRKAKYGRIVNIASIWSHMTMAGRSVYTATKFGLRGMSMTFAVELARDNVLVNVVAPGFTLTDMVRRNYTEARLREIATRIPVGRLATVEDISSAVMFLASDLNTYITGQSLVVDGGYTVA